MGNTLTNLRGTFSFEFALIFAAQAGAGQSPLHGQSRISWGSRLKLVFQNSRRDSNFICSIMCFEATTSETAKPGPCCCSPQSKVYAQLCAKGCFWQWGPTTYTHRFIKQTQLSENTQGLSLSVFWSIVYIYLCSVKPTQAHSLTHLHKHFSLAVQCKGGFIIIN